MTFALEIGITMIFGAGVGFLACSFFCAGASSDDADEITRLREENKHLRADYSLRRNL